MLISKHILLYITITQVNADENSQRTPEAVNGLLDGLARTVAEKAQRVHQPAGIKPDIDFLKGWLFTKIRFSV